MKKKSKKKPLPPEEAVEQLEALTLEERIKAVEADVDSPEEKFSAIDPFELARLLEVPQPEHPDNSWSFIIAVMKEDLEEHAMSKGPVSDYAEYLADDVSTERYEELSQKFGEYEGGEISDFSFLTAKERELLEKALNAENLASARDNGIGCKATYCVNSGDHELWFEAEIEDDGSCVTLSTPYDGANGEPFDTSDPWYVYETW